VCLRFFLLAAIGRRRGRRREVADSSSAVRIDYFCSRLLVDYLSTSRLIVDYFSYNILLVNLVLKQVGLRGTYGLILL